MPPVLRHLKIAKADADNLVGLIHKLEVKQKVQGEAGNQVLSDNSDKTKTISTSQKDLEKCQTLTNEGSHEVKVFVEQFSALNQQKAEPRKHIIAMKENDVEQKLAEEQQKAQNFTAKNAHLIY